MRQKKLKQTKLERASFDIDGWLADKKSKRKEAQDEYFNSPDVIAICVELNRRTSLPPENPEHLCGMSCDGQDGYGSDCALVRNKLYGSWYLTKEEIEIVKKAGATPCIICGEPVSNREHRTSQQCPSGS